MGTVLNSHVMEQFNCVVVNLRFCSIVCTCYFV